jgi:beta-galactosidase
MSVRRGARLVLQAMVLAGGAGAGAGWAPARGAPPEIESAPRSPADPHRSPATRLRFTLNDGWRYTDGDVPGGAAAALDDRAWTAVQLPHTWNRDDAFTEALGYRRGIGWYRKSLVLDPALRGRRLFLHFEGANQIADVYVNGTHAGRHIGGYTAFAFDITELARVGAPNVVAVRVDNSHHPDVPPLNADFTFYGGIYRDVWLVATGPVHVTLLDHASPGVFIDTPSVSADAATVRVRGTVVNATAEPARLRVAHRILDADGAEVAVLRGELRVPARATAPFQQTSGRIARPRLWSPDEPALYRVVTELHDEGGLVDRVENPLGFRWLTVDARGLSLNGVRRRLHGTNRHQDREGYGNAVPNWVHREDVRLVKETGFELLRLAHYPQDPVVLEETDRQGLLVWEEIPVVNLITPSDAFAANAERMLVEMIRQHYNHPSVLMWGYMNEVMLQQPDPVPPGYRDRIVALARRLESRAKAEDPTRPTVTAISFEEIDNRTGFQDIPDILGLNLYFGWYYRSLAGLGPWLDSLHRRHPTRPIIVSEYGADSDERIHSREARAFDFSADYQERFHEETFPQLAARDWLVATAVWNQFDFGVKGRHDSKPNLNQKGLFYYDREPKDIAFYYRALLRREPVLRLATRDGARRAGSREVDRAQTIKVYTNLPEVELLLGDSLLGVRRPENAVAEWTVALADGDNRLRARGRRGAVAVEDAATVHYTDRAEFFRAGSAPGRSFAVNAGSHYSYVEAGGEVWEPDRGYETGAWGHVGGDALLIHHRIFGTDDDALYQAAREGAVTYRFDVPPGSYELSLRFAEPRHDRAGARVFDVLVNDQPAFTGLDLAGQYGRYTAVDRTIRTHAAGGGIVVRFVPRAGSAIVSGIGIRRL